MSDIQTKNAKVPDYSFHNLKLIYIDATFYRVQNAIEIMRHIITSGTSGLHQETSGMTVKKKDNRIQFIWGYHTLQKI